MRFSFLDGAAPPLAMGKFTRIFVIARIFTIHDPFSLHSLVVLSMRSKLVGFVVEIWQNWKQVWQRRNPFNALRFGKTAMLSVSFSVSVGFWLSVFSVFFLNGS